MPGSVSLTMRDSWSMGNTTPVSLLACMIDTSRVSGESARMNPGMSRLPFRSTSTYVTRQPFRSISRQTSSTAGCSTVVVMICFRFGLARTTPWMAVLLLSVAHPVKRISLGSAPPRQSAIVRRAAATAWLVRPAGSYIELGLK